MTNCLRIGPGHPVTSADQAHVAATVAQVRQRRPDIDPELMTFIGELLVLDHPGEAEAEFAVRFAQVSSPVMAKGVEDTAFYRYQLLISLNEVGGDPGRFGAPVLIHRADLFSCRSGSALTMPVPHGPA